MDRLDFIAATLTAGCVRNGAPADRAVDTFFSLRDGLQARLDAREDEVNYLQGRLKLAEDTLAAANDAFGKLQDEKAHLMLQLQALQAPPVIGTSASAEAATPSAEPEKAPQ